MDPNSFYARINLTAPIYNPYIKAINRITNGLGEVKKLQYLPHLAMPQYQGKLQVRKRREEPLPFPVINNPGILNVVTYYEQEVAQDEFLSIRYLYYGPKYHKLGKGFLGFDNVWQLNDLNGTSTELTYDINNTWYHIVNTKTRVLSNDALKPISVTTNEHAFRDMGDADHLRYFPYLKSSLKETYNMESNVIKRYAIDYENFDDWGNPEKVTERFGLSPSGWPISKVTEKNYLNISNNNIHRTGLVDDEKVTYKKTGQSNVVRNFDFEYYETTNGFLKKSVVEPGNDKSYSKDYVYDDFGNLKTTTLSAAALENRFTQTLFTNDGRFLDETINPEGHAESFDYYPETGLLKTRTDANDLITTYKYDIFGGIKEVIEPDGNITRTVKRWSIPGTSEHEDAPATAYFYVWNKRTGSNAQLTFYDQFSREVRQVSKGFDGTNVYVDKEYLGNYEYYSGLLYLVSNPYFKVEEPDWTQTFYDRLRRPKRVNMPDGSFETYTYAGNNKTIVTFDGQTKKLAYNGAGWLEKVTDNNSASIYFAHFADGQVGETSINNLTDTKIYRLYDTFRQLKTLSDPDKGITRYLYTAFGELEQETDALGEITTYQYDKLGRMTGRTIPDGQTNWYYDTQAHGIGKLHTVMHVPGGSHVQTVEIENEYNPFGLLSKQKQTLNGEPLEYTYGYDAYGRQKFIAYPSGYRITNYFNEYGYLLHMKDPKNQKVWEAEEVNALGMYTKFKLGESVNNQYIYDDLSARITDIKAGRAGSTTNLQNMHYEWFSNGNLDYRKELNKNLTESFQYDAFNRLHETFLNNSLVLTTNFDELGNIENKTDVGEYTYGDNAGAHAVTSINATPETISTVTQDIIDGYTSFDKIAQITEGELELEIGYGHDLQRVWQKSSISGTTETQKRYFNGLYELITNNSGNEKQLHYLNSPNGIIGIFTIENNEVETLSYILKDHLGSLTHVLDESGNLIEEQNFDAWGRRRNPQTWTYENVQENYLFDRGYTMHEHLDGFKLINMNGRMFDPVVARFLSVDPVIQFPENSQSYNRYSYVLNNPLRFTDPSGFLLDWFINEKTGDVYYNSAYNEGDVYKLEGEGWVWFGEDDVFTKDKPYMNGMHVVWQNDDLYSDYKKTDEYDKSMVRNDSKLVSFNVEASFKGQKALTFMKRQGYEFKPVQQIIYSQKFTVSIQGAPRQPSLKVRITEKSRYLQSNFYETGWSYNSSPKIKVNPTSTETTGRSQVYYSNNKLTTIYLKIFNLIYPDTPVIWDSWSQYPNNIELINEFINKYGKQ